MKEAKETRWRLKISVVGTSRKAVIRGLWGAVLELYDGKNSGAESEDNSAYTFKLEAYQ